MNMIAAPIDIRLIVVPLCPPSSDRLLERVARVWRQPWAPALRDVSRASPQNHRPDLLITSPRSCDQNKPGFATTAADQLAYDEWIATTVHGLGLAVFQKNDLDQVGALEPFFDGILDEECNQYSECSTLTPYVTAGKPAWDAAYKEDGASTAAFCAADIKGNIVGALFALDLDGSLFEPCTNDVGMIH